MNYRSLRNLVLLVICAVLTACASMDNKTDYPYQSENGGELLRVGERGNECLITLNGAISYDLVRAFKLAAEDVGKRKCSSTWVLLTSQGGFVNPAYTIGNLIREKGFNTRLSNIGGVCASACGMIFIGGVKREARDSAIVGAHLGFHQITHLGNCARQSAVQYKRLLNYALPLLPVEGAELFVKLASDTGCTNLQTSMSFKELHEAGIITGASSAD